MHAQTALPSKVLPADFTMPRLLPSVRSLVGVPCTQLGELLVAKFAFIRLIAGVYSSVDG